MNALILAAGLGTRLRPLTDTIPKPMVLIDGKPLLERLIAHLAAYGVKEILMNLHYLPEKITDYFGDGSRWGVRIVYKFEPTILGTAGAIKNFEHELDQNFVLLYGDMLHRLDIAKLVRFHREKGGLGTVVVKHEENPESVDIAELADDGRILRIIPKPHDIEKLSPAQWKMLAVYVFSKEICRFIPSARYVELDHEVLPRLIQEGRNLYGYPVDEPIFDIGTWERYREAEAYFKELND